MNPSVSATVTNWQACQFWHLAFPLSSLYLKISNIIFACTGMRGFSVWLLPTAHSYTPYKPATCYSPDPLDVSTVVGSPTGSTNSKEILKTTERNESKVYHSKRISYARTGEWGPRCLHPFSRGSCSDWCAQASSEVCPSSNKLAQTCGWTLWAWVRVSRRTGRRKIAYKRSSPYGVGGGEDPGFPAQSWRHGSTQGVAVGSFVWMILPGVQRPCFHLCVGQGGHTKLEVNFLCRNASSRAKTKGGWGQDNMLEQQTMCLSFPASSASLSELHLPIPAPF